MYNDMSDRMGSDNSDDSDNSSFKNFENNVIDVLKVLISIVAVRRLTPVETCHIIAFIAGHQVPGASVETRGKLCAATAMMLRELELVKMGPDRETLVWDDEQLPSVDDDVKQAASHVLEIIDAKPSPIPTKIAMLTLFGSAALA